MERYQRHITITARTGPVGDHGGMRRRAEETKRYDVVMTVDSIEILQRLAGKAAKSKGKQAKALHGLITVKVRAI